MRRQFALNVAALLLASCVGATPRFRAAELVPVTTVITVAGVASPRVLCVVAHPDDEIAFAGALYKTSSALGGACDIFTITNGEGGFKYATLAERIYGKELTDESVGRAELPAIRKRELAAGCRFLGVRRIYFLSEKDHRYTQDEGEVLGPEAAVWDLSRVRAELDRVLAAGHYDFVFTHLPVPETHAHHKAATILALEAVSRMPESRRPAILAARVTEDGVAPPQYAPLPSWPFTAVKQMAPFSFNRRQTFGHQRKLDYRIVANWAVAEHKSQGTMQLAMNRGDREEYLPFAINGPGQLARAEALFVRLAEPQFVARIYGDSAGTNAR